MSHLRLQSSNRAMTALSPHRQQKVTDAWDADRPGSPLRSLFFVWDGLVVAAEASVAVIDDFLSQSLKHRKIRTDLGG